MYPSRQAASAGAGGSTPAVVEFGVEQSQVLPALIGAASLGIVATLFILRRQRKDAEAAMPRESRFAASTEGEKICPHCGMGNLWTDSRCVSCRRPLR